MIIYGSSISPFVRKVLVALNEKGIRYEHRPVAPQAEDADFRAASPMGKIPAIDHDGFRLADSSAILDYIEHLSPQPALIPPTLRAPPAPAGSTSSARSSSIESSPSCSRSAS